MDVPTSNRLKMHFLYTWAQNSIMYLGIQLTNSTKTLFASNYLPLQTKLQNDLTRLAYVEFSWLGRLAAFKMFHLPSTLCVSDYTHPYNP